MPLNQTRCWLWWHQSQQHRDACYDLTPTNSVVGASRFSLSVSLSLYLPLLPLYRLRQYTPRTHHWHAHSAPGKTQSLKNKYIMPIAVKQVGVVAVWAFRLTQTDSFFCPLTECIYSKPPPTLWIPGIDFLILKLNELLKKKRKRNNSPHLEDCFSFVAGWH